VRDAGAEKDMATFAPILVLGAGPAGLAAALARGDEAVVLEAHNDLGGLCRTIELDGAVFDLGGHSFHTPHPAIRELVFGALPMYEQPRNAWCFVEGEWIPYPFQKHFERLANAGLRTACRAGLGAPAGGRPAANFEEYLDRRFGPGITGGFLRPYNQKLWGHDLARLAVDWVGERVPEPGGAGPDFPSPAGRRTPLQDDTSVAYPACGGFGEVCRALARRVPRLHLGQWVAHIDLRAKTLTTRRGDVFRWGALVSTLALPRLLGVLSDVPPRLLARAGRLEALPVTLVMLTLTGRLATDRQRVYCPGPEIPAHKIVLNHNSSPYLRGLPRHGILAEVSGFPAAGEGELVKQVVRGLVGLGLLTSPGDVRRARVIRLPAAYPVPTHARAAIVTDLKRWLEERAVRTVGRFGEWAYINSDEALYRGLSLGRRLARAA
jgi:protoporphyrinogen oxidase